jgi:NADP-dependent 3-hydroxy acid dehydrogenase YdfG
MSHKDRVYAVTGAGSGIGRATALILAQGGAKLSLADLSGDNLHKVKAELEALGAEVHTAVVNVANSQQVEAWVKEAHTKFGRLDGACNSAGVSPGSGTPLHVYEDKGLPAFFGCAVVFVLTHRSQNGILLWYDNRKI